MAASCRTPKLRERERARRRARGGNDRRGNQGQNACSLWQSTCRGMGCGIVFGRNCAVQEHSLRTQSRQQSELSRRGVGCPVLASKPDCWLTPCREPRAHCSSPKATMFMKRRTVTSRAGSKTRGNAKLQVIETKPVTCSMVVADAFFAKPLQKATIFMKIQVVTRNL